MIAPDLSPIDQAWQDSPAAHSNGFRFLARNGIRTGAIMVFKRTLLALLLALMITACSLTGKPPASTPLPAAETPAAASPTLSQGAQEQPVSTADAPSPAPSGASTAGQQPVEVKGNFSFTNEIILRYYIEHAASLTDMYGFVIRDKEWEIPVSSQNLGFMKIDPEKKTGIFEIQLPAQPEGQQVDVNPDGNDEPGVQIFAADYLPNLTGSPYAEGDDISRGWPSYLASVKTDSENKDEVTGGKLIIWSPDENQFFPSGFGADGLLFTDDDPVMPVPYGYSAVNLDADPFQIIRETSVEMTLFEPADAAIKDFSDLSYQESFDQMFAIARNEYAFNGIEGKQPDWDALYDELAPRVKEAGEKKDAEGFFLALRDFTLAFKDGHVGLNGGDVGQEIISESFSGGYGFAARLLDDGRVMVVYVVEGGPAAVAGMLPGGVISQFAGKPVKEALAAVKPPTAPFSMESSLQFEQARYLPRAPLGTKTQVTFTNPQGSQQSAELSAIDEQESLQVTSPYRNYDPNGLPVEYVVASSSIGYIRINSNYDDLNLIVRLYQRALEKFTENEIEILIIDMRANSGGANLGLAGYLTDQEIPLGRLEYYSEKTGKFEAERPQDRMRPYDKQYSFSKMFLLIDHACASACELESYSFSQVPGMVVVGETPTSGTEAEVSRGQFEFPEGISLQIPTGRFVLPDGSIFLEGQGVQPTELLPVNEETVLSGQDPLIQRVLQMATQ